MRSWDPVADETEQLSSSYCLRTFPRMGLSYKIASSYKTTSRLPTLIVRGPTNPTHSSKAWSEREWQRRTIEAGREQRISASIGEPLFGGEAELGKMRKELQIERLSVLCSRSRFSISDLGSVQSIRSWVSFLIINVKKGESGSGSSQV